MGIFDNLGNANIRTADFRDFNNDGIDDRDQGFQGLPANLPINNGNNPIIPPIQTPKVEPMGLADSYLGQLQQSSGLSHNQIRAVQPNYVHGVPQNKFVGKISIKKLILQLIN